LFQQSQTPRPPVIALPLRPARSIPYGSSIIENPIIKSLIIKSLIIKSLIIKNLIIKSPIIKACMTCALSQPGLNRSRQSRQIFRATRRQPIMRKNRQPGPDDNKRATGPRLLRRKARFRSLQSKR
jgi:hypothetical protein